MRHCKASTVRISTFHPYHTSISVTAFTFKREYCRDYIQYMFCTPFSYRVVKKKKKKEIFPGIHGCRKLLILHLQNEMSCCFKLSGCIHNIIQGLNVLIKPLLSIKETELQNSEAGFKYATCSQCKVNH